MVTRDDHKSRLRLESRRYVDFIIDVDDSGDPSTYTSNPDALANFFGANPNAPNFLTQVHFRKDVLDKYYQKPSHYSVESGFLRCGGEQWGLPIDDNHDEKVCAWLGDLGRIPYDEQLHWRSYNIPPSGGLSETFYKNQILAHPTDSERLDHLFKRSYDNLQIVCKKHLGWPVLIPLDIEDRHHLETLRIPSTDEQHEFDEVVLSLTKIVIDSINERKLREILSDQPEGFSRSGLSLLEAVLEQRGVEHSNHIMYLRTLQSLRSTGVAHRKGTGYKKVLGKLGTESQGLRVVFSKLLKQATDFLDFIASIVERHRLKHPKSQ